jgi:hypothetical protein
VLCANDIYAVNMMDIDIDAMGIPDPERHSNAARGAEREKKIPYIRSETEKSKKPEICPKRRGPRWDLNPRGCEQGIGSDLRVFKSRKHSSQQCLWGITTATPVTRGVHSRSEGPWR